MDYSAYQDLKIRRLEPGILEIVMGEEGGKLSVTTARMHAELARIWLDVDLDPDTRVAILRGAGKGFSAGGDLAMVEEMTRDFAVRARVWREARDLVYNLINCSKMVVSAMHGPAVGAGLVAGLLADMGTTASAQSPAASPPLPSYMQPIAGRTTSSPAQTATDNVLALNPGMFALYDSAANIFQRNILSKHPVILGLFSGAGGRFILYRPGQAPLEAPQVPIVYQLMKSVGHSTMALSQVVGPYLDNPADQSWRGSMLAYRSRMQSALDGLDATPMQPDWRDTVRTILTNNLAFMDECLNKGSISFAALEAFTKKQGPILKKIIAWAAHISDAALGIGYGVRVGVLNGAFPVPAVSVSWMHRSVPRLRYGTLGPALGTGDQFEFTMDLTSDSYRAVAGWKFVLVDVAAGIGIDRYKSSDTNIRFWDSPTTTRTVVINPTNTRALVFVNGGLSLAAVKLVGELGLQAGKDQRYFTQFSGFDPKAAHVFGGIGVRFGF